MGDCSRRRAPFLAAAAARQSDTLAMAMGTLATLWQGNVMVMEGAWEGDQHHERARTHACISVKKRFLTQHGEPDLDDVRMASISRICLS